MHATMVILTGYIHNTRGEFVYAANYARNPVDAMFDALAFAAANASDFEGTVTARLQNGGE